MHSNTYVLWEENKVRLREECLDAGEGRGLDGQGGYSPHSVFIRLISIAGLPFSWGMPGW